MSLKIVIWGWKLPPRWQVRMIDSWTDETAVTTAQAWIRQRGRWIKGYAQTALVTRAASRGGISRG